jgi:hypothetical protein
MAPLVDLDWLSMLLITGTVVPALGATVFGFIFIRRRGSQGVHPITLSIHAREAP